MIKEHISRIKALKKYGNFTLEELANESGISKHYICRYLGGNVDNTTVKTMQSLTEASNRLCAHRHPWGHTHNGFDGAVSSESPPETPTQI